MIEPLQARQMLLDELRKWLASGLPLPGVRTLAVTIDVTYDQARLALIDLERLGDVRIRRAPGDTRRWVTAAREKCSWSPRRKFVAPPEPAGEPCPRDQGRWPADASFSDDPRACRDRFTFARLPATANQSLTGSTAAWAAEG